MGPLARIFIFLGIAFLVIGGLIYLLGRFNLMLGRLPGDFRIQNGNLTIYLPCGTSILLSILLTVILTVFARLFKK